MRKYKSKYPLILFVSSFVSSILLLINHLDFHFLGSLPTGHRALVMAMFFEHKLDLGSFWQSAGFDVITYGGKHYSAFAPGASFTALPFFVGEQVFSWVFVRIFGPMNGVLSLFLESLAMSMPTILSVSFSCVLVYKLCRYFKLSKLHSFISAWALPFTTFLLVYSGQITNHIVAMFVLLLASYILVTKNITKPKVVVLAGFLLGLGFVSEYPTGLYFLPAFVYLFYRLYITVGLRGRAGVIAVLKRYWGVFLWFVIGYSVSLSAVFIYNFALFGNPLTFGEGLALTGAGSAEGHTGIDFATPLHIGLFGNLLSPMKGLIFFAPLAFAALPGFFIVLKSKFKPEALLFSSYFVLMLFVYSVWRDWAGGFTVGPRFLISTLPYLFVLAGFYFNSKFCDKKAVIFAGAVGWFFSNVLAMRGSRQADMYTANMFKPVIWNRATDFFRYFFADRADKFSPFIFGHLDNIPFLNILSFKVVFVGFLAILLAVQLLSLFLFWRGCNSKRQ